MSFSDKNGRRKSSKRDQLNLKDKIWQLRNSSLRDRRREADKLTMSPNASVINAAIKGPQQLIASNSIECLVSLHNRKVDKKTAVVFAGGLDGWIRAWSIHYKSGLLGQFRGSHRPQDAITSLAVDKKNLHLFSADSRGYIKVWFIGDYCTKVPYTSTLTAEEYADFTAERRRIYQLFASAKFFRQFQQPEFSAGIESINPTPEASDPANTVKKPTLLCSFRAHIKPITTLMFADNYQLIFSGSEDHNVRAWTINGRYVGQLGTHLWPTLDGNPLDWIEETSDVKLPQDVRRVATPRTLRCFYGGVSKKWKLVKNGIMRLIGPWFKLGLRLPSSSMSQPEKSTTANTPTSIPATPAYSNEETLKVPFSVVKDQVHTDKKLAIPKMSQPIDVESSKILGKAYKKITNHRAIPTNLQLEIVEDTVAILLLYSVVIYTCMFSLSDSSTSSNM